MPDLSGPEPRDDSIDIEAPWEEWAFPGWAADGSGFGSSSDGVQQGSRAYVLVPGEFMKVGDDGVIPTFGMTTGLSAGTVPSPFGFLAADPDNNPDTWEGGGLGVPGFSGEGVRGAGALTTGTGDEETFVGEAQYAQVFSEDVTETTIEHGTMGLGLLELDTWMDGETTTTYLYFNYSNIGSEPKFNGDASIVEIGDDYISYHLNNPFTYSEEEGVALREKFGWDPTLGTGDFTNPVRDGYDKSIDALVDAIISTYPQNLSTFPRTPPLKLRRKDWQLLRREEADEEGNVLGTVAIESTISETAPADSGDTGY